MHGFFGRHQERMNFIANNGNQVFHPKIDYGANLFVPKHIRVSIFSHFEPLQIDHRFISPIDSDLYSSGLGSVGKHASDSTFERVKSLWESAPQSEISIRGPFVGKACLYYLMVPHELNYFRMIRMMLNRSGISYTGDKLQDFNYGWINVAWFRKERIPLGQIAKWENTFAEVNNTSFTGFVPNDFLFAKSDWQEKVYDGEIIRNKTPKLISGSVDNAVTQLADMYSVN